MSKSASIPYQCLMGMSEMEGVINPQTAVKEGMLMGLCWMIQGGYLKASRFPYKGNFQPTQELINVMRELHPIWKDLEDVPDVLAAYERAGLSRSEVAPTLCGYPVVMDGNLKKNDIKYVIGGDWKDLLVCGDWKDLMAFGPLPPEIKEETKQEETWRDRPPLL